MKRWGWIAVALSLGCSSSEPRPIGTASVGGDVFRADGSRWSGVVVEVACAGSSDTTRLTASAQATFLVDLEFPSDQPSTRACRFATPSLAEPQAATNTTIQVYPPNLQPLQVVTLTEGFK
jgi:hypothetical protein